MEPGQLDEQGEPVGHGSGRRAAGFLGEQVQGGPQPLGGGRGGLVRGRAGRLDEHADGQQVSEAGRAGDVAGAGDGGRVALVQGGGDPRVRGDPPARAGGGVREVPDDGVAEAEPPGGGRAADHVPYGQLVEGRQGLRLGRRRGDGHHPRFELVAERGGGLGGQPRVVGKRGQFGGQRFAYGARQQAVVVRGGPARRGGGGRCGAGQRFQVQRIAATGLVQRAAAPGPHGRAEEFTGLAEGERRDLDPGTQARRGVGEGGGEPGPRLAGAVGDGEEQGAARRVPGEVGEEFHRALVGPVHVVQQDREAAGRREGLQQEAYGAVHAVAVEAGARGRGGVRARPVRRQGGEDVGEQPRALRVQGRVHLLGPGFHLVVQRVHGQ